MTYSFPILFAPLEIFHLYLKLEPSLQALPPFTVLTAGQL